MAHPTDNIFSLEGYDLQEVDTLKIAIIDTEWNPEIMTSLLESANATLLDLGIAKDHIDHIRVPGAYELPLGAKYVLGSTNRPDAIICLGCVIQGATKHDDYINHTVAKSIAQIGLMSGVPVIFGVLTTNTLEQAQERSGGSHGNKGKESAYAALKMISLKQRLLTNKSKISF